MARFYFRIDRDKAGDFRARFMDGDTIVFSSEGFSRRTSAQNAIESVKKNAPAAPIEDNS